MSEPAFPFKEEDGAGGYKSFSGMTLRDWFAGMAMLGYLASGNETMINNPDKTSFWSYEQADAMLKTKGFPDTPRTQR